MLLKILDWLDERSTWRGIAMLLAVAGISMSDMHIDALVLFAGALYGLVDAFTKDPQGKITHVPEEKIREKSSFLSD
jgi:hypothetical protein